MAVLVSSRRVRPLVPVLQLFYLNPNGYEACVTHLPRWGYEKFSNWCYFMYILTALNSTTNKLCSSNKLTFIFQRCCLLCFLVWPFVWEKNQTVRFQTTNLTSIIGVTRLLEWKFDLFQNFKSNRWQKIDFHYLEDFFSTWC